MTSLPSTPPDVGDCEVGQALHQHLRSLGQAGKQSDHRVAGIVVNDRKLLPDPDVRQRGGDQQQVGTVQADRARDHDLVVADDAIPRLVAGDDLDDVVGAALQNQVLVHEELVRAAAR